MLLGSPIGDWKARLEGNLPPFIKSNRDTRATIATHRNNEFLGSSRGKPKKTAVMWHHAASAEPEFDRTWVVRKRQFGPAAGERYMRRHSQRVHGVVANALHADARTAARVRKACGNKNEIRMRSGPLGSPTANSAAGALALSLVAGSLQKFALLVLAHLLAALLDHVAHGSPSPRQLGMDRAAGQILTHRPPVKRDAEKVARRSDGPGGAPGPRPTSSGNDPASDS